MCLQQLPEASYSTISDIIDRIDKKARERFRNLKQAKAIYDDVARGYADRDALHPLDIIQIDHTRLDMQVIDDQTGLTIDRPWITLGIDVFSRMPWCLYISFEAPSANVVRKAIQHGVFFKNTKKTYGTESDWEAFGIPNVIYVDNGMDFKSSDIKRLVNETLKSEIMHRPVRIPKYGAVIERLFLTINDELIHNILGTTKSKFADLGEIKPEEEACLTLNQIRSRKIPLLVTCCEKIFFESARISPMVENSPVTCSSVSIIRRRAPTALRLFREYRQQQPIRPTSRTTACMFWRPRRTGNASR